MPRARTARTVLGAAVALVLFQGTAHAQSPSVLTRINWVASAAPTEELTRSADALRDSLVALARSQVGSRYVYGGTTPRGFDCSGLMLYIMARLNIELPRTAHQQSTIGTAVPKSIDELLPGDLLTFGTPNHISHIGIYIGDGRFVHASSVAGRVVERVFNPNLRGQKPWIGVQRVLFSTPVDLTVTASSD